MKYFLKVDLQLTPDALRVIAAQALEKKTGARGLRAILVSTMLVTGDKQNSNVASPNPNFSAKVSSVKMFFDQKSS